MAKYDRLKKCKCNGCPLSVDVVTDYKTGNGVCEFHHVALANHWMDVKDRIQEHREFLVMVQLFKRLDSRYKPFANPHVNAWFISNHKEIKNYILNFSKSKNALDSMIQIKSILNAKVI